MPCSLGGPPGRPPGSNRDGGAPLREQPVGSQPFPLAVNPVTGTVYAGNTFQAASMSVFATRH